MLVVQWERITEDWDGHEKRFTSKWHRPYHDTRGDGDTFCGKRIPERTRDAELFFTYEEGNPTCKRCRYMLGLDAPAALGRDGEERIAR